MLTTTAMRDPLRRPLAGPAIMLFGPLALSFDYTHFAQVRKSVVNTADNKWILETVDQLPRLWNTITAALPSLQVQSGHRQLVDLAEAFRTGRRLEVPSPLPNRLLIPLVVMSHLAQYAKFLGRTGVEVDDRIDPFEASKSGRETLGLCTGLLSAFAVSSAGNRAEFEMYGAVAIRLGMLIGMAVDAQDATSELKASKSLGTAWNSAQAKEGMLSVMEDFPDAYVSVDYDENRATVTSAVSTIRKLQQRLKAAGIIASELGLHGRFHAECHHPIMASMLQFCHANPEFQFPDASMIVIPTRSNDQGGLITQGGLHCHALESILTEPPKWHQTFSTLRQHIRDKDTLIISFGPELCVPPSHMLALSRQVVHLEDIGDCMAATPPAHRAISENDIAVVGMSCKVAGAENLEEYWDLLCEAKSQHKEVPKERISFKTAFREVDPKRKWFANLIDGPGKFDHKFFKKSPRESMTMDPQQRLLLQIAYQAVEQSGYFNSTEPDRRIGCYIGLCASDYEGNVACHPPNAFSATGNLQGFAAGKVSHHFGWTGPGLTIDTACSSSAVAVHQACRAIISGECNAALAGGTHVMTSPVWFQNLAGASFLSTTGQCKPFDAKADGYCRGEGVGAVFLKKLSAAVSDGDQILGVVAATAVQQNQNCTPIFVPNVPSLSDLFRVVTKDARLLPNQITVVEAHGTGTAVGDPAEYDSIRQVFGGAIREKPLVVSSVKGLIGHVECTSGIVSMIKVLLMINKGLVPPQASFSTMNPAIKAVPADRMSVPTSLCSWETGFRAALVNNYGASGSNASMVLTESPLARLKPTIDNSTEIRAGLKYPFWLCGLDDQSLRRYSKALTTYLGRHAESAGNLSISNLAFNLARQSNRALDRGLVFIAQSVDELEQNLALYNSGSFAVSSAARPASRPVVLCFGGQISTFVGLDRHLYETMAVLRKHLDNVDAVARSLDVGSIYPSIFERTPIRNIVKLQTVLFAIQYACARSWIDSGLQPSAVVGHSFGELTALCISQVLSMEDTLKLIVGRACLIQDAWGSEKGAMMAVEADFADIEKLLADSSLANNGSNLVTIACYNGPKSFTLAGPDCAINAVSDAMNKMPNTTPIRAKKLNVTNAFHCALVDPLLDRLEESAQGLTFREPTIPIERATEFPWQEKFTPKFVPDHMRLPVFFNHAIQRLTKRYPSAVFLEAGSCSTITSMASRALGSPNGSHFQAINITSDNAWNNLADATVSLWKAGLNVHFWAHQATQITKHTPLLLPPYQFDESSHWLELKAPSKLGATSDAHNNTLGAEKLPDSLLTFLGYQEGKDRVARFRINTMIPQYDQFIAGHIIAQTAPICPSIVQLDLVIEAVRSIRSEDAASKLEPQIHLVENQSPLCVNPARQVYIEIEDETAGRSRSWSFRVLSTDGPNDAAKVMHTTGRVDFCAADDVTLKLELSRLERLMGHQRFVEMMSSGDVDEILSHRNIYGIFSEIVEYSEDYRGLQKLVGQGNQSAGYVTKKHSGHSGIDNAFLTEAICQVGGIWVNCMTGRAPEDMFLANGIERWIRSPKLHQDGAPSTFFHVLATHHRPSDKTFLTDVFVYDADDGSLVEAILGISFVKVAKATIQKLLTRLTPGLGKKSPAADLPPHAPAKVNPHTAVKGARQPSHSGTPADTLKTPAPGEKRTKPRKLDVAPKVKAILAELSGLEPHEIKNDSGLADLGIDSLLGMEMAHEIEAAFDITLPTSELIEIIDMPGLMKCVQKAVGAGASGAHDHSEDAECDDLDTSDSRSDSHSSTTSSDNQTVMTTPQDESDMEFGELKLSFDVVMEAFNETKSLTDERIAEYGQTSYVDTAMPMQTQMCIALTLEAFKELGVPLDDAKPGQRFPRISHPKEHSRLVEYLYKMLEKESRLITVDDTLVTRTAVSYPTKSSKAVLQELVERFPDQYTANKLAFYTGSNLAQVLLGKTDGIKLVFGTSHGRELVSGLYGEWPLNRVFYKQMEDFLSRLVSKLDGRDGPLKILEMGAGTGGTTRWLVPLLASLDVPVEYTFTDLAPSFVAAARKKFKPYPFMRFRTHDIEKAPENDLVGTQHIVIASNAVHATHSLSESTGNIRKLLRADGFLLMLEMTDTMYWVDMIFGLFEGWWYFDDGRTHAVTNEESWQKDLQSVGYGHVDWTDGQRPENKVEKLIIAMASGPRCERLQIPSVFSRPADLVARQAVIDSYVRQFTAGFAAVFDDASAVGLARGNPGGMCVVVTGATGSLGSHIIANLACRPDVTCVVCLNRRSRFDPMERQLQALVTKGIFLPRDNLNKLQVRETDLSRPQLGLPCEDYEMILDNATHIVHNAWLMNAKWPLKRFEAQMQIMRNLLDVAGTVSSRRPPGKTVTFQFVSSIATVGYWPLWTGNTKVPEERMTVESVLPTGYGDAKYICELMLDETLHRYPARFRTMAVRPGQVAGSSTSGYWNPMEHLSFMVKSSQTLKALPDLDGLLSWTPVDTVAGTLVDLLTLPEAKTPYAMYHIDNPVRQQWKQTLSTLAHALDIPRQNMIPLAEWVQRVKDHPRVVEGPQGDNPAILLIDFLEDNFVRMSCGGLLLDTARAREHSKTLANCGPVSESAIRLFVQSWKDVGFLTQ